MQFVDRNGAFKDWNTIKHEYDLQNSLYSHWMQLKCHKIYLEKHH